MIQLKGKGRAQRMRKTEQWKNSEIFKKRMPTIEDLREFLQEYFLSKKVRVYLFGSRARGTGKPFSDIDLALVSSEDLSMDLALLRDYLEESNLPYKVDLLEYRKADQRLQEIIKKEGILWIDTDCTSKT